MWNQKVFSERLTTAREARGITKRYLAAQIGVTEQAVGQFEQGLILPSLPTLVALSRVLQVSLDYLAGESDTPKK